jgi:hypothetical protein
MENHLSWSLRRKSPRRASRPTGSHLSPQLPQSSNSGISTVVESIQRLRPDTHGHIAGMHHRHCINGVGVGMALGPDLPDLWRSAQAPRQAESGYRRPEPLQFAYPFTRNLLGGCHDLAQSVALYGTLARSRSHFIAVTRDNSTIESIMAIEENQCRRRGTACRRGCSAGLQSLPGDLKDAYCLGDVISTKQASLSGG